MFPCLTVNFNFSQIFELHSFCGTWLKKKKGNCKSGIVKKGNGKSSNGKYYNFKNLINKEQERF